MGDPRTYVSLSRGGVLCSSLPGMEPSSIVGSRRGKVDPRIRKKMNSEEGNVECTQQYDILKANNLRD